MGASNLWNQIGTILNKLREYYIRTAGEHIKPSLILVIIFEGSTIGIKAHKIK